MATTDDHPIEVMGHDYKPVGQSDFEEYLRKQAAGIVPERNEAAPQKKPLHLYDDPPNRDGDANWGEEPHMERGQQAPAHQHQATYEASEDERKSVTERSFTGYKRTEQADQAYMGGLFDNVRKGNFTAHAPTLQSKIKQGSAETLSAKVRSILDRF